VTGRGGRHFISVCRSVFPHVLLKNDAARITKLDTQMFHDESWKPVYFGVKRSKDKVISHKTVPEWVFALLWVLASSSCLLHTSLCAQAFILGNERYAFPTKCSIKRQTSPPVPPPWRTGPNVVWRPTGTVTWWMGWNVRVVFDSGPFAPISENTTSSRKPEVHNYCICMTNVQDQKTD